MRGFIQVYTGDGKGKTTAALGLAVRAAGAGLKVYIGQFVKMGEYSEIKALKRFSDLITIEQFGRRRLIGSRATPEDIKAARRGLKRIKEVMAADEHEVIIMEEANVAVTKGLIPVQDLLRVVLKKPERAELVITGRGTPGLIIDCADLVTEMRPIKHYFKKGVRARVGIEK